MPTSSSSAGVVYQNNSTPIFHTYGDVSDTDPACTNYGALTCNVFVGALAGNFTMGPQGGNPKLGNHNTGVGFTALNANTTGWDNVALGDTALTYNTTGYYNSALGAGACEFTTTGSNNTCVGASAMLYGTTAAYNVVVGADAAYHISSGTENVMAGFQAGFNVTTGSRNILIGSGTDYFLATGSYNVAIGEYALDNNVSGSSSIAIGAFAGRNQTASNVLIIDDQNRSSASAEAANAIIYGTMASTAAQQTLTINAGTINLNGKVSFGSTASSSTVQVGGASCIELGNSDGSAGVNYITVLNGNLSVSTTKPSNCR